VHPRWTSPLNRSISRELGRFAANAPLISKLA
jgi:hypothetical protein